MQKENENWFSSWFNTPYYHILYKDRGYDEAATFMENLTQFLNLKKGSEILDLACGRGRHSKYLNALGYDVTGVDLSSNSIDFAKKFENNTLHFDVHDMCVTYPKKFDAVLNLFTSFGYFETENDNLRTIKAIKQELKPNGFGVIDFMNSVYIKRNLVAENTKTVDGITFRIKRTIENNYIFKTISFSHKQQSHTYVEKVKALTLSDFKDYFKQADVELSHCFGDYELNTYDKNNSERLILIFK